MKMATTVISLSGEFFYACLMIMTWVVLLGWTAAVVSACALLFRREDFGPDSQRADTLVPAEAIARRDPSTAGFGL